MTVFCFVRVLFNASRTLPECLFCYYCANSPGKRPQENKNAKTERILIKVQTPGRASRTRSSFPESWECQKFVTAPTTRGRYRTCYLAVYADVPHLSSSLLLFSSRTSALICLARCLFVSLVVGVFFRERINGWSRHTFLCFELSAVAIIPMRTRDGIWGLRTESRDESTATSLCLPPLD